VKAYFIILTALFSSCVSNHYDRTESFTFSWKIGDFDQASQEIEKLAESGLKREQSRDYKMISKGAYGHFHLPQIITKNGLGYTYNPKPR
jgi:hypothetical protein